MSRNARNGENGERSPEGWQFKLDAKSGSLESDDFGENGEIGDFGEIGNLAKMTKKSPGPLASGDFGEIVRGGCPRTTFAALFWRICNSVLYYLTVIE